jgi:hypothetical protein
MELVITLFTFFSKIGLTLLLILLGIMILLYFAQDKMLYIPNVGKKY